MVARMQGYNSPKLKMKAQILRGSKQEIAEGVARISGEIREAIVFIEDSSEAIPPGFSEEVQQGSGEDIFVDFKRFPITVLDPAVL